MWSQHNRYCLYKRKIAQASSLLRRVVTHERSVHKRINPLRTIAEEQAETHVQACASMLL